MNLDSKVTVLPKVGPKYGFLLQKLEIETVKDLIEHYPFRYEDYSQTTNIADVSVNSQLTIKAQVIDLKNIHTKYGKKLTNGVISDGTGELKVVWFNQHYLEKTLEKGKEFLFTGKVNSFNNKPTLVSPQIIQITTDETNPHAGRLIPIYSETLGVSSKWLRQRIFETLQHVEPEELLPIELIEKNKLEYKNFALNNIHFPLTLEHATTARRRLAYEELFLEMLKVHKRKDEWHQKYQAVPITHEQHATKLEDFYKSLPFELTTTQKKAIKETLEDLSETHPMNRLIEGDVGTGKTMVALVASYLTYLNGHKTIYMAPTEILAKQHYETFKTYLEPLGLNIGLLTSNAKRGTIEADILIGTHALIFTKDKLENVELIVIDEQHRFGVGQRAKIVELSKNDTKPHLLTMTATPIPRTLALTVYGDLDISVLDAPPNKDKKITTRVVTEKLKAQAYEWIRDRGDQAFIVCPLIEESDHKHMMEIKAAEVEYEKLKEGVFKNLRVGLLHGRMKPQAKEEIVEKFRNKELDILVSTPVVEVGIDIPDAAVMVIESAERYGLASLHQLRGRVGRGTKEGFCFLCVSNNSKSPERLKHMETISDGLKLAEIDLNNRGEGDVFGTMQSGFRRFKVADLYDVELLELTKRDAADIYKKLDLYPNLKVRTNDFFGDDVLNN